jgi:hypothetical protein
VVVMEGHICDVFRKISGTDFILDQTAVLKWGQFRKLLESYRPNKLPPSQ